MDGACYPLSILPGMTQLFAAFLAGEAQEFYPSGPHNGTFAALPAPPPQLPADQHREALAALLEAQNRAWHAGQAASANIDRLRRGARAVVTGQQVGLFGGPLYTLHKAATAVRVARAAAESTGIEHVPVFWLATEDHDFAEVDHVTLLGQHGALERVALEGHPAAAGGAPVGALRLGPSVSRAMERAADLLGPGPQMDLLSRCWRPEATFAGAFAQWLAEVFREQGLIVFDPAGRAAHAMGAAVLRRALVEAERLEALLLERGSALERRGFHRQVLVKSGGSLLFLMRGEAENAERVREPLRRIAPGTWQAGAARFDTAELLAILEQEPERLSPNALLRPVFQDAVLPTAAYIGGPAEIAYFAQNAVVAEAVLGRVTPVLPRLSATLLTRRQAAAMERDGFDVPEVFRLRLEEMQLRLGARSMPVEGKRRLQAAGETMATELEALTAWMQSLDEALGRAAITGASKMRYQMNRLRRMAARWETEKDASIARRVERIYTAVFPQGHAQERITGAASALAQFGAGLPSALVEAAGDACPGHKTIVL